MPRSNIGHYRIIEKLGEGGMAEVYKAEDTRLKRLVAIKLLLRRDRVDDEQGRLRFLQEARAASALNHPNIVQVHEFDSYEGEDFIVMEYLQGMTLSRLVRARRLTLDEVLDWSGQMAVALGAAHAAGIVHRDIEPATSATPFSIAGTFRRCKALCASRSLGSISIWAPWSRFLPNSPK